MKLNIPTAANQPTPAGESSMSTTQPDPENASGETSSDPTTPTQQSMEPAFILAKKIEESLKKARDLIQSLKPAKLGQSQVLEKLGGSVEATDTAESLDAKLQDRCQILAKVANWRAMKERMQKDLIVASDLIEETEAVIARMMQTAADENMASRMAEIEKMKNEIWLLKQIKVRLEEEMQEKFTTFEGQGSSSSDAQETAERRDLLHKMLD